jgi:hypothetical protein
MTKNEVREILRTEAHAASKNKAYADTAYHLEELDRIKCYDYVKPKPKINKVLLGLVLQKLINVKKEIENE